jgi:hypothetical protein
MNQLVPVPLARFVARLHKTRTAHGRGAVYGAHRGAAACSATIELSALRRRS